MFYQVRCLWMKGLFFWLPILLQGPRFLNCVLSWSLSSFWDDMNGEIFSYLPNTWYDQYR
jgi:hypothetical protein